MKIRSLCILLEKPEYTLGTDSIYRATQDKNSESLRDKPAAIQKMRMDYDRKGILKIISEIEKSSNATKELLDTIKERVTHGEFKEAERAAAAYAAALASGKII